MDQTKHVTNLKCRMKRYDPMILGDNGEPVVTFSFCIQDTKSPNDAWKKKLPRKYNKLTSKQFLIHTTYYFSSLKLYLSLNSPYFRFDQYSAWICLRIKYFFFFVGGSTFQEELRRHKSLHSRFFLCRNTIFFFSIIVTLRHKSLVLPNCKIRPYFRIHKNRGH